MTFQIHPLPRADFADFTGQKDSALATKGIRRITAGPTGRYPCRVSLGYAEEGESLLLMHHVHLPDDKSPYRSGYAIYVREDAEEADPAIDEVPALFENRTLAVRGFGHDWYLREAEVVTGQTEAADAISRILENPEVAEIHLHFAAHGCYAARATRAW